MLPILVRNRTHALIGTALLLGTALSLAPAAHAQSTADEARVRKLEAQVRALQRKVFPDGAGAQFQPEITAPPSTPSAAAPTSTPVTDLLARMDAVEAQLARATAQAEQNANHMAQIDEKLAAMSAAAAPVAPVGAPPVAVPGPSTSAAAGGRPTGRPGTSAPAKTTAARTEAVKAIERPQTDDAGDDAYSYGFRLYDAKFYPEAEQQLKLYLQKYPKHSRVSYARNLLGRAYLADGDALEAAKWFLQNYQADKTGPRAPDSLLYLARSMKQLGDKQRACTAVGEFGNTFAAEAAGRLKADYDDTRKGLNCA